MRPAIPRSVLKAKLAELSARYKQRKCDPSWLDGKAGEFLIDHFDEIEAIFYGRDNE